MPDPVTPAPGGLPSLFTPRLALRPAMPDDRDAMLAYRGRADVCRYLPFEPMTPQVLESRLRGDLAYAGGPLVDAATLLMVVLERDSGSLIGDLTLFNRDAEHRGAEIGWVLHPDAGGRGYATEAASALLGFALGPPPDGMGLHRVVARMDARNDRSAALAERLGMRREAHFVRNEWFKGEWTDGLVYAVLAEEWPRT